MADLQDYPSRISDDSNRKLGTFSYLPRMHSATLRR